MFLGGLCFHTMGCFEVLVPILVYRQKPFRMAALSLQRLGELSRGLDASGVMVQAEEHRLEPWVLLQHPQHGLISHAAEGDIAVCGPLVRIERQEGQQVDGRFEHIELVAVSCVVEAVPGDTALHIDAEGLAEISNASLVGMTGNAVFVLSDEHGVVIFPLTVFG